MKKLIIHIGTEKTGTTSIQHFCAENRLLLKEQGLIYPEVGFCDFAHFSLVAPFHSLDNGGRELEFAPKKKYVAEKEWDRIKKIFNGNSHAKVLISAEHFSSRLKHRGISALKETIGWLGEDIEVEIVIFVRRQDKYFQSWYSTHIKAGGTLTFDEAFESRKSDKWFFDYYNLVNIWASYFGKESIKLGVFEKGQMKDGLFSEFCNLIDVELHEEFNFDVVDDNFSWPARYLEFARLVNLGCFGDNLNNRRYKVLDKLSRYFEDDRNPLISPEQVRCLLDSYKQSNYSLATEYLGRSSGELFFDSEPSLNSSWEKPSALEIEDISDVLVKYISDCD
ncbi:hypothetical protein [Microbulbifer sp. JMSA008]|uniref:hypothetical protein n=1 Tax=Microbulbifer sp. JMSA008 TaxID=3243373 RepID=UPI004038FC73